jgi:hypothetical protein
MDICDVKAKCLTLSTDTHGIELDYEETRWAEILAAECGFFSAERLRRLLRRD